MARLAVALVATYAVVAGALFVALMVGTKDEREL